MELMDETSIKQLWGKFVLVKLPAFSFCSVTSINLFDKVKVYIRVTSTAACIRYGVVCCNEKAHVGFLFVRCYRKVMRNKILKLHT